MDREEIEVWKSFLKSMMSKISKAWTLLKAMKTDLIAIGREIQHKPT